MTIDDPLRGRLAEIVRDTPWLWHALAVVQRAGPPGALIAAGAIRDTVWSHLTGRSTGPTGQDVDVVFHDPTQQDDAMWQRRLEHAEPGVRWEVVNQAWAHRWSTEMRRREMEPHPSLAAALATWPETATAVGVSRRGDDVQITAPCGLDDLFGLVVRHNPVLVGTDVVGDRVRSKRWTDRWPELRIASTDRRLDDVARAPKTPRWSLTSSAVPASQFLQAVPDLPRYIEARGVAMTDQCDIFRDEGGWIVRNMAPGGQLVVLVGRPDRRLASAAIEARPHGTVMGGVEDADAIAAMLPGWRRETYLLYRLGPDVMPRARDPRVRALTTSDDLGHLDSALRSDIEIARASRTVLATFVDGAPVAFAYSWWRTARLFDISVDTAPGWRRRGCARAAVSALIGDEMAAGRAPVWGARDDNVASLGLATALGLERHDAVVAFERPVEEEA